MKHGTEIDLTDAFWRQVQNAAARLHTERVPDSDIRMVKAAFAMHKPRKVSRAAQLAHLLFDSSLTPALEGVRASAATLGNSTRQMLYRGGSYVVDLRLEPQETSGRIVLVGQVLNLAREGVGSTAVRAVLERGRLVTAAAVTNEFGEFVLEYEERGDMRLRVEVPGQKPLLIPLEALDMGFGAGASRAC